MSDSRGRRLEALRGRLLAENVDAILVTSLPNIRYLTGFSGSSGLLVATLTRTVFITDFRYETQVADYTKDVDAATGDIKDAESEMKTARNGRPRVVLPRTRVVTRGLALSRAVK